MRISAKNRLTRTQKSTAVGLAAAAGVAALTAGVGPAASGGDAGRGPAKPVAGHSVSADNSPGDSGKRSSTAPAGDHATSLTTSGAKSEPVQLIPASDSHKTEPSKATKDHKAGQAAQKAKAERATQVKAEAEKKKAKEQKLRQQAAQKKAQQKKAAERKAAEARSDKNANRADRSTRGNSLDGWIKQARAVMKEEGIPGSHQGIKKNIMRESGGNPNAVNNWDINAQKGTPSKGLLQTIQPTFDQYHVKGTANDLTDPVANITAACNYAADKYGSMDNVNSAY
jgi:flagellar biosynthesis GTPase FlhF